MRFLVELVPTAVILIAVTDMVGMDTAVTVIDCAINFVKTSVGFSD